MCSIYIRIKPRFIASFPEILHTYDHLTCITWPESSLAHGITVVPGQATYVCYVMTYGTSMIDPAVMSYLHGAED